jgi:hypothetical protein
VIGLETVVGPWSATRIYLYLPARGTAPRDGDARSRRWLGKALMVLWFFGWAMPPLAASALAEPVAHSRAQVPLPSKGVLATGWAFRDTGYGLATMAGGRKPRVRRQQWCCPLLRGRNARLLLLCILSVLAEISRHTGAGVKIRPGRFTSTTSPRSTRAITRFRFYCSSQIDTVAE